MNKKFLFLIPLILLVGIGSYFFFFKKKVPEFQELQVENQEFVVTVSSSGTVEPENKISITAPISGRIDKIIFEEGKGVRKGQVIAWMSSSDRAALLDSAQVQGGEEAQEWRDVYKPTPILSPATGVIIAKNIVVGQTVNQNTVLFELSDRLVIIADVDETDLGKIRLNQSATVTVDSFPGIKVETTVSRIAHQSKVKNAINTYEVLLKPDSMPPEFRSGLTASVQFLFARKESALVLPTYVAEGRENHSLELQVKKGDKTETRTVRFGLSNGQKVEILEGLTGGETILVKNQAVLGDAPGTVFGVGGSGRRRR
jgi:membrane fusion protein, macrolide-specific efflux system